VGGGRIVGALIGGAHQVGYVIDFSGNIGTYELIAAGGGTPGVGAFGAVTVTSADQIADLSGIGGQGGASFFYGGGEFLFGGYGEGQKPYLGVEGSGGINLILAEGHGHVTYTQVDPYFNVKDVFRDPKFAAKQYIRMQLDMAKKQTLLDEAISLLHWLKELYKSAKSEKKCKGSQ
jgi:hypothetical protein